LREAHRLQQKNRIFYSVLERYTIKGSRHLLRST
jgi:hypothetical protein